VLRTIKGIFGAKGLSRTEALSTPLVACFGPKSDVSPYKALPAQIDLFAEKSEPVRDIVTATFKSTRIVNGQSIENVGKGVLDFRILHRFGQLSDGGYNLFGLDQASMRLGLDYGITKTLMVGIGRSTFEKQYDGTVKMRLLSQSTGGKNFPLNPYFSASSKSR
jgi:hypothetical protein